MSFVRSEPFDGPPEPKDLFLASFLATFVGFLLVLGLYSFAALVSGSTGWFLSVLLFGGFYGTLITGLLAILVVGPLGMLVGLVLLRAGLPDNGLGLASGALTAVLLILITMGLAGTRTTDLGIELAFFTIVFAAIGGFAGWVSQRFILRWPQEN